MKKLIPVADFYRLVSYLLLSFAVLGLALGLGCTSSKLATGPYNPSATNAVTGTVTNAPDMAFYVADSTFVLAYTTLDTVFSLERDNREYFWKLSPSIKRTLDAIRPTAFDVVHGYLIARATYIANPTPLGLTGIQSILARVQQLVIAAQAALPVSSSGSLTNAVPTL